MKDLKHWLQYTESNTGHYAKNGYTVSHRASLNLKTMAKNNSVNK